jgi:putative ABC transport system ATP-binding protein
MDDALVKVESLSFAHRQVGPEQLILNNVSMHLNAGEVVVLTGPSGSGKSTLLTIIGGLRSASQGSVQSLGTEVVASREKDRVRLRRRIGFIFQQHNLAPALTVAQNIQLGLQHSGAHRHKDAHDKIEGAADAVGMGEHLRKFPRQLSGGQQQRVGIARALVNEPKLVLADEPTASLDKASGEAVLQMFDDFAARGSAVVLVTHDKRILEKADRILMLDQGEIVPPADSLLQEATSTVRTLMELDPKRFGRMLSFGHALAQVALADGSVDADERQAIYEAVSAREVFNGPEVELVVELALAQAKAWTATMADDTSREALSEALQAVAKADQSVTDDELRVIAELGKR